VLNVDKNLAQSPMNEQVPEEFLPQTKEKEATEEDGGLGGLFADGDSDNQDDSDDDQFEDVTIGSRSFRLRLPPDVGTLFAHRVWSGSKLLARFLESNVDEFVRNKRTIEFGAGTALPSLIALANGSSFSAITDYPDDDLLGSIRETVGCNWQACLQPRGRVAVVGHEWGTSTDEIRRRIVTNSSSVEEAVERDQCFDLAILSECLWMHRCHEALASSLDGFLHPTEGVAVVTYAHHIPGKEEEDDAFFDLCESMYGIKVRSKVAEEMEYMWDRDKTITVYLVVLCRSSR
jgi:nicotinamide N-methyltransferase